MVACGCWLRLIVLVLLVWIDFWRVLLNLLLQRCGRLVIVCVRGSFVVLCLVVRLLCGLSLTFCLFDYCDLLLLDLLVVCIVVVNCCLYAWAFVG